MASLNKIVQVLDRELDIASFEDSSNNGLQVANSGRIRKVCCGVDASMEFFEEAKRRGADLLICHHGLSWGDSLKRIVDLNYRRVGFLIRNDIALYACHLPLDAHPRLGNNALLFKALGLRNRRPFGLYAGRKIGFRGELPKAMKWADFKRFAHKAIGGEFRTMEYGRKTVGSVAIVSGGAADELAQAAQEGVDVYVSGEANLHAYNLAREYGIHAIFAGHYATEVFGVRALGEFMHRRFKIEAEFVDLKVTF